jgi:hypothetical protein
LTTPDKKISRLNTEDFKSRERQIIYAAVCLQNEYSSTYVLNKPEI